LDGAKHYSSYSTLGCLPLYITKSGLLTQAAYAAPIIMMSQNRITERDRVHAQADYQTNLDAKLEIEQLATKLNNIEVHKLDKIIKMLEQMEK
jgi:uncharacterized membrane protein